MKSILFLFALSLSLGVTAQDFPEGEHYMTDKSNRSLYLSVSEEGKIIDEFVVFTVERELVIKGEAQWFYEMTEPEEMIAPGYYMMRTQGPNGINYQLKQQSDSVYVLEGPVNSDQTSRRSVYYLQSPEELELSMSVPEIIVLEQMEEVVDFPDEYPSFPGGDRHLSVWISENVQYPEEALNEGIMGNVYVRFMVEKDGSLTYIEIMRTPHPLLSKEVIRLVKSMPKWEPAIHHGVPVRSRYTLPVRFFVH